MLAISTIDLAAVADSVTLEVFILDTESEYDDRLEPNITNCLPNVSKSLSPANQDAIPPLLPIVLAISITNLAAVTDVCILPTLTLATDSEYADNDSPKATNCLPNVFKSLSPENHDFIPPLLPIELDMSTTD